MSNRPWNLSHHTLSASLSEAAELSTGSPATGAASTRGVVTAEDEKQVKKRYNLAFDARKVFHSLPVRNPKMMVRGVLYRPNDKKITRKV